jgi:hypothetical protein
MLRGGASLASAAEAAGLPASTLRDWVRRGAGKSNTPPTPKLRKFAKEVGRVKAEAVVSAQVRMHKDQPGSWLRTGIAALENATEDQGEGEPDLERIRELSKKLRDHTLRHDPLEVVPRCPNSRCRCMFHRERTPEELAALRALEGKEERHGHDKG